MAIETTIRNWHRSSKNRASSFPGHVNVTADRFLSKPDAQIQLQVHQIIARVYGRSLILELSVDHATALVETITRAIGYVTQGGPTQPLKPGQRTEPLGPPRT